MHRIPDRLADVLGGPHPGVARRGHPPAQDFPAIKGERDVLPAVRGWLDPGVLAKKVVFFRRAENGMRVSTRRKTELEGVGTKLLLEHEAVLERLAGILVLDHARLLGSQVQVTLVPGLEVGKFVGRRQARMSLAVALDLCYLVKSLETHPRPGVFLGQRLAAVGLHSIEHEPIREVAVVGDGKDFAAGLIFVTRHPFPEILGVDTIDSGVWRHLVGEFLAVAAALLSKCWLPMKPPDVIDHSWLTIVQESKGLRLRARQPGA